MEEASGLVLAVVAIVLGFLGFFYRPPSSYPGRVSGGLVVSPADGVVKSVQELELLTREGKRKYKVVHIFIGLGDVHTQVYPLDGVILKAEYYPTSVFKNARGDTDENEHMDTYLHNGIVVKQIAGKIARRIETFHPVGSVVKQGEHLGKITLGSGCELYLPIDKFKPRDSVKPGVRVRVGETVIAEQLEI